MQKLPNLDRPKPDTVYPWAEWFDGDTRLIQQGPDFTCRLSSMVWQLRRAAHQRNLKITLKQHGTTDRIMFRTYPRNEHAPDLPPFPAALTDYIGPECRICHAPLNGFSTQYGQCATPTNGDYTVPTFQHEDA